VKRFGKLPFVCLITEGKLTLENYKTEKHKVIGAIRAAVDDGIDLIQIREREIPARLLFELTCEIVDVVKDSDALVLVNDRADVAIAAGAEGVHLRESSLTSKVVRELFPREFVVGVSTHDIESIRSAGSADFVFFGPVFESPGKGKPAGTGKLQAACRAAGYLPVIALGGIDGSNVELALKAGASGVAGIRSMHDAAERRSIVHAINAHDFGVR
jgi:thiamine-phosphate pyrophosphorylase